MEPISSSLIGTLETLLVVDDNEMVLKVVVAILERANFRVLSAHSGADAIRLAGETHHNIHLLLADVDMPQMSGPELGGTLKKIRPDMRVMLMSGGVDGMLVLNYGWAYLQKPFMAVKLVQMVNAVLHTPDRSQLPDEFDRRKV
jgi:two-component system cell cycle sensor histidine kinase/response regulator CckA